MIDQRGIEEGNVYQGEDEEIAWKLDVTAVGSGPTSPAAIVKDITNNGVDVTSTVMPTGSPSVLGNIITLPILKSLTAGREYRIEVVYTISGNIFETPIPVSCRV